MSDSSYNSCGGCTACCLTHAVRKIKSAGVWCQFCDPGQGCRVYARCPRDCRDFRCEWLKLTRQPLILKAGFWRNLLSGVGLELLRPDRLGVVLDYCTGLSLGNLLQVWEAEVGALSNVLVWDIINVTLDQGEAVMQLYLSGRKVLLAPSSLELTPAVLGELARKRVEITQYPMLGLA